MSRFTGHDGDVTFNSGYDLHVVSFDITDEATIGRYVDADTVAGGDLYEKTTEGTKRWSGSFTCHSDPDESLPSPGTLGSGTFTTQTGRTWSGDIRIETIEESLEIESENLVQTTFSFQGDGSPNRP